MTKDSSRADRHRLNQDLMVPPAVYCTVTVVKAEGMPVCDEGVRGKALSLLASTRIVNMDDVIRLHLRTGSLGCNDKRNK